MAGEEHYTLKQSVLRNKYGAAAERWEKEARDADGYYYDDRGVYCNVYRMMQDACEAMKQMENTSVCVAFNRYCDEQCETLDRILAVFKRKEAQA